MRRELQQAEERAALLQNQNKQLLAESLSLKENLQPISSGKTN